MCEPTPYEFPTDPEWWREAGRRDREIGNDLPGSTREDFNREIDDPEIAKACADAYINGFGGLPS